MTFILVLFPGEILRRIAPGTAMLEAIPMACRTRVSVSGRLLVCGWHGAISSSLVIGNSSKGIRGALSGLWEERGRGGIRVEECYISSASGVLIPLACRSLLVAWKPMMESWLLRPSVSGSSLQSSPEHPPR